MCSQLMRYQPFASLSSHNQPSSFTLKSKPSLSRQLSALTASFSALPSAFAYTHANLYAYGKLLLEVYDRSHLSHVLWVNFCLMFAKC
jgi:hypothetical protein